MRKRKIQKEEIQKEEIQKEKIKKEYDAFLKSINTSAIDKIWEEKSTQFRTFWQSKILNDSVKITDFEIDEVVRILDTQAKGNKKNDPAVARTMIRQGVWRKMFKEIKENKKINDLLDQIFKAKDDKIINLIDKLYTANEGNKNSLTGPAGIAINCFLFAYNPKQYCSVVSLNDRKAITNYFKFSDAPDYSKDSIGKQIYDSNLSIIKGFRKLLGVNHSPRVISEFIYGPLEKYWKKESDESIQKDTNENKANETDDEQDRVVSDSKNIIFYGPPGTGKTYGAIEKAVAIIDGESPTSHEEAKKRYDELKAEGRIEFITFHQSFSYEEFVEGIRPELAEASGSLKYKLESGIFKKIAVNAAYDLLKSKLTEKDMAFINVKNKFREKFENQEITSLKTIRGREFLILDVNDECVRVKPKDAEYEGWSLNFEVLRKLYINADKLEKPKDIFTYGEVKSLSAYYFYVAKYLKELEKETDLKVADVMLLSYEEKEKLVLDNLNSVSLEAGADNKFVLIIDEINRGNIAKILGELITLIEPDKRLGEANSLIAKLPYSKKDFGVPPNLYILGTMNTADRSVEALDTALRRRFSFEKIEPEPSLLKDITIDEVNMETLLGKINSRIEILYDRDHLIGHSYFMGLNSGSGRDALVKVFKDKIIPLLQEYFYSDWGKIKLILGESFISSERANKVSFAAKDDSDMLQDYEDKYIFGLKPSDQWDFKSILQDK